MKNLFLISILLLSFSCFSQSCIPILSEDKNYINNLDGTTTDPSTGLMWQRCPIGTNWENGSCAGNPIPMDWQTALFESRKSRLLGYSDWRLPNLKELLSIVDFNCDSPAINEQYFNVFQTNKYWTSTPIINYGGSVYSVSFGQGGGFYNTGNDYTHYIRLVRYK